MDYPHVTFDRDCGQREFGLLESGIGPVHGSWFMVHGSCAGRGRVWCAVCFGRSVPNRCTPHTLIEISHVVMCAISHDFKMVFCPQQNLLHYLVS